MQILNNSSPSPKQAFNAKVRAVEALRTDTTADASTSRAQLRKALKDRNGYLVARAADVTADRHFDDLIPDLLAAYERFFVDPVKSDPQCLAKTALARALRHLGHHGAAAFLRGIGYVQLEPAWGGRADTAASLRGTCALALTDCALDDLEILTYLTDALADPDKTVRIDAAMAVEQLNRPEGALLLRLKLLIGDAEPDVMGQCFTSMLSLAPFGVVAFISRFLKSRSEGIQLEAASALAQCRDPHAIEVLREFWQDPLLTRELRQALIINLGASPLSEAATFLLDMVSTEPITLAVSAVTTLATSRYQTEFRPRLEAALKARDSTDLQAIFATTFPPL